MFEDIIIDQEIQYIQTNVDVPNQAPLQEEAEGVQETAKIEAYEPKANSEETLGRVFGVSKKLTSAVSAGIFYLGAVNSMPPEVLNTTVLGVPVSVLVAGFLGILNGVYILIQGQIDLKK